jgi:hypothetical protein
MSESSRLHAVVDFAAEAISTRSLSQPLIHSSDANMHAARVRAGEKAHQALHVAGIATDSNFPPDGKPFKPDDTHIEVQFFLPDENGSVRPGIKAFPSEPTLEQLDTLKANHPTWNVKPTLGGGAIVEMPASEMNFGDVVRGRLEQAARRLSMDHRPAAS